MDTEDLDGRRAAKEERKQDYFILWPEDNVPRGVQSWGIISAS